MNLSLRTLSCLSTCPAALLLLGWMGGDQDTATPTAAPTPPVRTALNHWVFDVKDVEQAELRNHAWEVVAHMTTAHPEAHFQFYQNFPEPDGRELHVLLETVDTEVQRVFLDAYGADEVCRDQIEYEDRRFEVSADRYMRLIASDPVKEKGRQPLGLITWSLEARFPLAGRASECIEQVVAHLNATYPEFYFRGYDEWFPRSGRFYIYIHGTGIALWEGVEARIRRDPVFRELMEGSADVFVEGSFEDAWHNYLAR
jgi:hypothetical protein